MGRKKWFRILLCCECFLFFMLEISGCSGQAPYKQPSSFSSIASEPETAEFYQDEQLHFTFRIPPCWISESPLYTQETIFDESSKNGYTSFYYAHDPSVPLLRIFLESQKYSSDKFRYNFHLSAKIKTFFFLEKIAADIITLSCRKVVLFPSEKKPTYITVWHFLKTM